MVAPIILRRIFTCLNYGGDLSLFTLSGVKTELDIRQLMGKRLRVIGSVLRSRSLREKIVDQRKFYGAFLAQVESGADPPC